MTTSHKLEKTFLILWKSCHFLELQLYALTAKSQIGYSKSYQDQKFHMDSANMLILE